MVGWVSTSRFAVDSYSSFSCILAELLAKKPIFPGRSEIDQLELIYKLCGTPNDENWPGAKELSWWATLKPAKVFKRRVREIFKEYVVRSMRYV